MNPPLRSDPRREALFERLADGRIDVVATDHAPTPARRKPPTSGTPPRVCQASKRRSRCCWGLPTAVS